MILSLRRLLKGTTPIENALKLTSNSAFTSYTAALDVSAYLWRLGRLTLSFLSVVSALLKNHCSLIALCISQANCSPSSPPPKKLTPLPNWWKVMLTQVAHFMVARK